MGKFVKVAAPPPAPLAPPATAAGAPGALIGGAPGMKMSQLVANFIMGSSKTMDALMKKFPNIFTLGSFTNPNQLMNKILENLDNKEFQTYLLTFILPGFLGQNIKPSDSFQPGAFQYYLQTPGYGGDSIASGAYQMQLERMPTASELPPKGLQQFLAEVRQIDNQFGDEYTKIADKQKALKNLMARYNADLSGFRKYLVTSFPGLK